MKICTTFFMPLAMVLVMMAVAESHIPTTLDGPFDPVTHRFDPSLRQDSEDLRVTHPRLRKNVTSNFAEQIALAISSPTSMWVSWVTGDAQIGLNVTPIDSASVESEVWYGKESGKYISVRKGDSVVYSLLYPFEGLWNYTSGIIHHVKLKVSAEESGSKSKFYYSFDAGGIHFIMLGAYVDYNSTGAQFAWLKKDLLSVDGSVIIYTHHNDTNKRIKI
ncbi:Purple acid phosphatase 23 [Glycine soja]